MEEKKSELVFAFKLVKTVPLYIPEAEHTSHKKYWSPNRSNTLRHDPKPGMLFINSTHSCYHSRKLSSWACKIARVTTELKQHKITAKGFAAIWKSFYWPEWRSGEQGLGRDTAFPLPNWKGRRQPVSPTCKKQLAELPFAMAVIFLINSNVNWSEETPATMLSAFASSGFPLRK